MWLLTNKLIEVRAENCLQYSGFRLFSDSKYKYTECIHWCKNGHYHSLCNNNSGRCKSADFELEYLYQCYGKHFIKYLNGNFTLIRFDNDSFMIYGDHFGINKYFYWISGDEFVISDDLKTIVQTVDAKPSQANMAIYALTYHFIGSRTLFENVYYNRPAEVIEFKGGTLKFSQYWHADSLLIDDHKTNINDISDVLQYTVKESLRYTKGERISLSLTAGVDSRLLLSALLKQNINIHTYTYGNPQSIDCKTASQLAVFLDLVHVIHDIRFSKESFYESVLQIIRDGHSLCSLHRAHRYEAIKNEAAFADVMYLGTMGGEFIKGSNHDDYIISNFVYAFSQNQTIDILKKYLCLKGIRIEAVDCDALMDFFCQQNWCKYPELTDFYALVEIAAGLHHAQNNMLFQKYFKAVVTPFLDIDYLKVLFQSDYHFITKKQHASRFRRRLENHCFAADLQSILNNSLIEIPYNSGFKAKEYRINPIYAAFRARLRKHFWKFPPNFPLGNWMYEFVLNELSAISCNNSLVNDVFEIPELLQNLTTKDRNIDTETQWLKYTTPVQMNLILGAFS